MVTAYLKKHPTGFRVLLDPKLRLSRRLFLNGEPATALFDVNDDLVWSAAGMSPATKDDLPWRADRILPGAGGSVPLGGLSLPR